MYSRLFRQQSFDSKIFNIFYIPFIDINHGFVHNLSPIKRSKSKSQWYDFTLQTSPTKVRRVVGFNIPSHSSLMEYQESKNPIVLKNTQESKEGTDIIFNQQSTVRYAPAFDIDFEYSTDLASSSSTTMPQTNAINVNLEEVPRLETNQSELQHFHWGQKSPSKFN